MPRLIPDIPLRQRKTLDLDQTLLDGARRRSGCSGPIRGDV
jgi:hypothetical protein